MVSSCKCYTLIKGWVNDVDRIFHPRDSCPSSNKETREKKLWV
jgi:hypothetical protein